jgi:hypothetical protein
MSQLGYYNNYPTIYTTNDDEYMYGTSFGSELVLNGDFSSGLTSWAADAGWTHIAAGTDSPYAKATGAITDINLTQNLSVTSGNYYKVEFTLVQPTLTNYQLQFSLAGYTHSWIGSFPGEGARTYQFYMQAANNGGSGPSLGLNIKATIGAGSAIGIKNISVVEVLTTATLHNQFMGGEFNPRKGSLESLTGDQSPWWIGD